MDQATVRNYVEQFFSLRGCEIVKSNEDELQVILNPETDKDLEYRPFYWTYVESANIKPELLNKRYIFNQTIPQNHFSDEYLFFGSRRLHQIFLATKKKGKYVRLYEDYQSQQRIKPLHPWLMVNYKVEFVCDTKKEALYSLGFNLISGCIQEQFFQKIRQLFLTPKLPNYMFTPTPLFSIASGFRRLEEKIRERISYEDDSWAVTARKKFEQEAKMLHDYFEELRTSKYAQSQETDLEEEWQQRLEELKWQYLPKINVIPVQFALVYLYSQPE